MKAMFKFAAALVLLSSASAQVADPTLHGWRQFSLPGLPEGEQVILRGMLESPDQRLVQTALQEILAGAISGRISVLSPEYRAFVSELVTQSMTTRAGNAPSGLVPRLPTNMLVLVDLVSMLPENQAQDLNYLILENSREVLLLIRTVESFGSQGKHFSQAQSSLIARRLHSMASGARALDERVVQALTWYLEKQFIDSGAIPQDDLVQALLLVAESGVSSRLKTNIYDTLLLLFQI